MTKLSSAAFLGLLGGLGLMAAPVPLYEIVSPVNNPQIDAIAVVNRSRVTASGVDPWESTSTRHWTNTGSGTMIGTPGFRFHNTTIAGPSYARGPLGTFVNEGSIEAGTLLYVWATNLVDKGFMNCGDQGLIKLEGTNVSLARCGLKAARLAAACSPDSAAPAGSYVNDPGISDVYWGAGTNNAIGTNGSPLQLDTLVQSNVFFGPHLDVPAPQSPYHEVLSRSFGTLFTNTVQVPGFFSLFDQSCNFTNYGAFVFRQFRSATNSDLHIVFVPTNAPDTNITVDVRFAPFARGNNAFYRPIIQFNLVDWDIVDEQFINYSIYFSDYSIAWPNGIPLAANTGAGTQRPLTHKLSRLEPCDWAFASPANEVFSPALIYNPLTHRTNVVDFAYAGYSARLGQTNAPAVSLFGNRNPALSDPTNFAGRIEVFSDQLNLDTARIRAENFVGIQTRNLYSNLFAQIDAPFVNLDLGSTNVQLVLSNLAPPTVNRFFGSVSAWSGVWDNAVTNVFFGVTNVENVRFHVLVLGHCLSPRTPVTLHRLAVRCTNLVVLDNLTVNNAVRLEARSLSIGPEGGLTFPAGWSWASSNVVGLESLTNEGGLSVPQTAGLHGHRTVVTTNVVPGIPPRVVYETNEVAEPYESFVNHGVVNGVSVFVGSRFLENSGRGGNPAGIASLQGMLSLEGVTAVVSNGDLRAAGDIEWRAGTLDISRTSVQAGEPNLTNYVPGAISVWATNRLSDGGPASSNQWVATAGVRVYRRPASGDLLGTRITSYANRRAQVDHIWPGRDMGAVPGGYRDNAALGWLTLDGPGNNVFTFSGPDGTNGYALYVDYLDLRNDATNYNRALSLAPNFVLYFADASVPPLKLATHSSGRLRWVRDYTGQFSSTNFTVVRTNSAGQVVSNVFTFNTGLARSKDVDSDRDLVVNSDDPDPFFTPLDVDLSVRLTSEGAPPVWQAVLRWTALAGATNEVEYATQLNGPVWQPLTNFIQGSVTEPVAVRDAVGGSSFRVYRVRQRPAFP